jgi:flavodoxin
MNSIVIYYSRTGNTKFVAEEIAASLKAELKSLVDQKNRNGVWGWLWAGFDALMQNKTKLEEINIDFRQYDLIFIGCPNWAANLPPALRTFLTATDLANKEIVLFCTQDSMGAERVFNQIRLLCQKSEIVGEKFFNKVDSNKDAVREQVRNWIKDFIIN